MYLEKFCCLNGGLRSALLSDMNNQDIVSHLKVLSLYGVVFTAPWMTLFYSDNSEVHHLSLIPKMKVAVQTLKDIVNEPEVIISGRNIFGENIERDDPLWQALLDDTPLANKELVASMAAGFVEVLERQRRYLTGDLSAPTDKMLKETEAAALHNMHAERIMALTDHQARRAPNAKIDFVEAKVKCKSNKTIAWFLSHETDTQDQMMKFVVSKTQSMTKEKKDRQRKSQEEILKRKRLKFVKKTQAERKKVEKTVKDLEKSFEREKLDDLCANMSECTTEDRNVLENLLKKPADFVGKVISQVWYVDEAEDGHGQEVVYVGHVIKLKRKKICTFVIGYHLPEESEDDSDDYDIPRSQIITDFLCGDLVLRV